MSLGWFGFIAGAFCVAGSFMAPPNYRRFVRYMGVSVLLLGLFLFDLAAILTDPDNLDYGLRPGRLLIPGSLLGLWVAWIGYRVLVLPLRRRRQAAATTAV